VRESVRDALLMHERLGKSRRGLARQARRLDFLPTKSSSIGIRLRTELRSSANPAR
jgi:hypothetical protein